MAKPPEDFDLSALVMGRLWKTTPFAEPMLTLEIINGPYKGIVFSFKTFHMMDAKMDGGFVPTKYETEIHLLPKNFPKDWQPTAEFDEFTKEVLFKWLGYINTNNLAPLLRMKPLGGVQ